MKITVNGLSGNRCSQQLSSIKKLFNEPNTKIDKSDDDENICPISHEDLTNCIVVSVQEENCFYHKDALQAWIDDQLKKHKQQHEQQIVSGIKTPLSSNNILSGFSLLYIKNKLNYHQQSWWLIFVSPSKGQNR